MAKKSLPIKQIKFIAVLLILVILFLFLGYTASRGYINKTSFENDVLDIAQKNEETIFSIDNIVLFSSCNADATVNSNSNLSINNLYQYTDIAIFLNSNKDELDYENTLKKVYINNIQFSTSPSVGTPNLYYKNINNFATAEFSEDNLIQDSLEFSITSEDTADLNSPTLYNNCANPITLSYINNNIKTDYTLSDAGGQITYDGSLLKKCNVALSSIACTVTFDIYIVNNLDQEFVCPVYIQIPLESEDGTSIYGGKVLLRNETNYTFYRYN